MQKQIGTTVAERNRSEGTADGVGLVWSAGPDAHLHGGELLGVGGETDAVGRDDGYIDEQDEQQHVPRQPELARRDQHASVPLDLARLGVGQSFAILKHGFGQPRGGQVHARARQRLRPPGRKGRREGGGASTGRWSGRDGARGDGRGFGGAARSSDERHVDQTSELQARTCLSPSRGPPPAWPPP